MDDDVVQAVIDEAGKQVAWSAVAFVSVARVPNRPVGSGTLVQMGGLSGILTAAHVLDALPDEGEVGIARLTSTRRIQTETITYRRDDLFIDWRGYADPRGPDLGFVALDPDAAGSLAAGQTFLNLDVRRGPALADPQQRGPYLHVLWGIVGEWTDQTSAGQPVIKSLCGAVAVVGCSDQDSYDLCELEVSYEAPLATPDNFQGVSGGGLWRIFFSDDGSVQQRELVGVPFWQHSSVEDLRRLVCHGPKSIYDYLPGKLGAKWPAANLAR